MKWNDEGPECPACGFVHTDSADWPQGMDRDGDRGGTCCGGCGLDFTVELSVSYSWGSMSPDERKAALSNET